MIQYYRDLESQVKTIQAAGLSGGQIQKIYSTAHLVSLTIRVPGKSWSLYLGRGSEVEGLWLASEVPPATLRRKDNFLEYLRRHLSSCAFLGVRLDPYDRIVQLDYQKFGDRQSLLLFWKARKVYFAHVFRDSPEAPKKLLLSWKSRPVTIGDETDFFSLFDEIGRRKDMKHDFVSRVAKEIPEILQAEEAALGARGGTWKPDFLERKKMKIEEDLNRARQWEEIQGVLQREEPLENVYELKVGEHRFKFEGELNAFERRNLLFEKIKKLKKGQAILEGRLDGVLKTLEEKKKPRPETESKIPITRIAWGEEAGAPTREVGPAEATDYVVYQLSGYKIGVGKSARGNDQLRSKWAGKDDLWLHLDGMKSAHAVIKMESGVPGSEEITLAAAILARFSHFPGDWIPVIFTQVKNLRGVSGVPGMVTFKKERHLRCPARDVSDLLKD